MMSTVNKVPLAKLAWHPFTIGKLSIFCVHCCNLCLFMWLRMDSNSEICLNCSNNTDSRAGNGDINISNGQSKFRTLDSDLQLL